jgi:lipid A 3-O-deacylase
MQDANDGFGAGRTTVKIVFTCLLLVLAGMVTAALGDETTPEELPSVENESRVAITLFFENDSTPLKLFDRTDRQYTSGIGLLIAHQPAWAEGFARALPSFDGLDDPEAAAVGYSLQQQIFTPDDLRVPGVRQGDRRYAGYLHVGFFLQRADRRTLDHIELDLGVIGAPSGGEIIQQNWHDFVSIQEPQGWDQQLPDEPTVQLTLRKKWRWALHEQGDTFRHEVIPRIDLALGTVRRHVAADLLWRASWMPLPNDFGPSQLNDPAAPLSGLTALTDDSPLGTLPWWSLYGYIRAGGMLVEHDTLIEGSDFHASTGLDVMPVVGRVEVGLEARWRFDAGDLNLGFYQRFMTDEFEGQTRPHSYGGIAIGWSWPI